MAPRRNKQLKVYVAAPWKHKSTAKAAVERLKSEGFTVTSRWVDFPGASWDLDVLRLEAQNDWADLKDSHVLVLLNIELSEGKAVEQGIALQLGLPIIGVGEPSKNVFHYLPHYTWVETIGKAVEELEGMVY